MSAQDSHKTLPDQQQQEKHYATDEERDSNLITEIKKKRPFRPSALHHFLRDHYFKTDENGDGVAPEQQLQKNSFIDFIRSHDKEDMKNFFLPEHLQSLDDDGKDKT